MYHAVDMSDRAANGRAAKPHEMGSLQKRLAARRAARAIADRRPMHKLRGENMLFSQEELAQLPAQFRWGHLAISHILSKFETEAGPRTAFPCIFARNVIKRGNLRFFLIPYEPKTHDLNLAFLLRAYAPTLIRSISTRSTSTTTVHCWCSLSRSRPSRPRINSKNIHRSDAVSTR